MKKALVILSIIPALCFGQTAEKKWGLGLHLGTMQYKGDYGSNFLKFKFSFRR